MTDAVAIKPAPDNDGYCLFYGELKPVWFSLLHHAINYAEEIHPGFPILIYEGKDVISRRIEPTTLE